MSVRRLATLQWVGLLAGAATWLVAHFGGVGITEAECNGVGARWTISNPVWQGTVMGVTVAILALAELCAVTVFMRTRGAGFGDGPPAEEADSRRLTRIHFFSVAGVVANLILIMIVLLDGTANLVDIACRQS
ncbi:MAG TPA: hypothetical protein VFB25_13540 [Gaiellaceae bacterium]|nr:hypothetical protein [Gaiellaceae bacterium]